jgi:iron-sulfur cluster assembly protein
MLTLTDNAASAIRSLVGDVNLPDDAGLRIAAVVRADGAEVLEARLAVGPRPRDQVIDIGDVRVFLDSAAATTLDDKTLGAKVGEDGEFRFQVTEQAG